MKNVFTPITAVCFVIIMFTSCSKSDSTKDPKCKTCRAFASIDAPPAEEVVCSEAEEAAFRAEHKQQEISCN